MGDEGCAICLGPLPAPGRVICDKKECRVELLRYAGSIENRRRVRAARERTHHQCPQCPEGTPAKPLTEEHFYVEKRGPDGEPLKWSGWCRKCKVAKESEKYHSLSEEEREQIRVRRREQYRQRVERRKADAEAVARERARKKASSDRYRQNNRERIREASKAYRERLKQDAERQRRLNENRRIAYRLRREAQGLPMSVRNRTEWIDQQAPVRSIPVAPLVAFLKGVIEQHGLANSVALKPGYENSGAQREVCELAGIPPRTFNDWENGVRDARATTVDRVLSRLGVEWWDVYQPGVEGYEEARAEFEGLEIAA